MKQTLKLIVMVLLAAVLPTMQVKAQSKEEITLTVSSDGATKDDALKNALRTAIEQAYGAFVSANTTILNDELVKDEIVTVSNGSIKDYKEVSSFEKPNGNGYMMTINATVSLPHLITYAKSHGSECEFAGNTFGMELKIFNLQKENELKVLYSILPIIEELAKTSMIWELKIKDPSIARINIGSEEVHIQSSSNSTTECFLPKHLFENSQEILNEISQSPGSFACIEMEIQYRNKGQENAIYKYLEEVIQKIAIPYQDAYKYRSMGLHIVDLTTLPEFDSLFRGRRLESVCLKSDPQDILDWIVKLKGTIDKCRFSFAITDNTGQISYADFYQLSESMRLTRSNKKIDSVTDNGLKFIQKGNMFSGVGGCGIFKHPFTLLLGEAYIECRHEDYERIGFGIRQHPEGRFLLYAAIFVPMSEINQYSSFKIIPKE